ncbi:hypothetical protein RNZ50_15855 [Paracoccaceae bacterium Fryx2]|nr:hypothetical protein [Paracoccaceae bacterium Fryx2]
MKRRLLSVALLLLAACATPQEIENRPAQAEFALPRNYQAVYADMLRAMRICMNPGAVIACFA